MTESGNSHIDGFVLDLDDSIYDDSGKLVVEVRDFGKAERSLVIRTIFNGYPTNVVVSWEQFTSALDEMRARMMSEDWDEALVQMLGTGGTE